MCKIFEHGKHNMSTAEIAGQYVRKLVEEESRGPSDGEGTFHRLEQKFGIPYWSLRNLWNGRAKTVEAGLFLQIRGAYLALCERKIAKLQHDVAIEKARGGDAELSEIEAEVVALAAKIRARKTAMTN